MPTFFYNLNFYLFGLLAITRGRIPEVAPESVATNQVIAPLAQVLFTDQLVAFEVTSVLLLVAIVGAVVIARRTSGVGQ